MRIFHLAFAALAFASPVWGQTEKPRPVVLENETIVHVEGEGFVTANPARMKISVGVATTATTAAEALDSNNRKLTEVIETLRAQGIAGSDIQTSGLEVEPQYEDRRSGRDDRIIGFRAENTLSVGTSDLEKAGVLISLLFEAGANTINGPFFFVAEADEESLARAAEVAALVEARSQAETIADALGMRISRVLLVSDRDVSFRESSAARVVITGSRIMPTPIEPGEIAISATYNVVYALVPR